MPAHTRPHDDAAEPPTYRVVRTNEPIHVDARLDEATWGQVQPVTLDFEIEPGENIPAPVRTECLIAYDAHALYVAFRAFDPDPSAIRAHLTDRDRAYRDDLVGIMLDTFNDKRRGYEFLVNPLGVQIDLARNEVGGGRREDDSWDAIWSSAGRITSEGYVVEFTIPFSSLRFPPTTGEQAWRIAPFRAYPRSVRHQLSSVPLQRDNNCFFCQVPLFVGFAGIAPSRNLEIAPTLTTERTDELEDSDNVQSAWRNGSFTTEGGVSARWGLTPNLSLNATLNPDFSQVEADSAQLATNTRYALFFPEKRPFFLEGADIFSTPLRAVHTRSIADPQWGAKLSGKAGAQAFGIFVARDRITNVLFPSNSGSSLDRYESSNTTGVVRYRRDIGESSAVGILATAREGDGYSNRVWGADAIVRLSDRDQVRVQALTSSTRYPAELADAHGQPTRRFDGSALVANYEHSERRWDVWAWQERYSSGFRADVGFVPRVDTTSYGLGGRYKLLGDKDDWFTRLSFGAEPERTTDHTGRLTDQNLSVFANYEGPLQSTVHLRLTRAKEYYDGVTYDQDRVSIFSNVRVNGTFTTSFHARWGDAVDYANSRAATVRRLEPGMTLDLGRHLALTLDHVLEDLNVPQGRLYRANLTQVKAVYQFDTRAFVRLILQRLDLRRTLRLYLEPPDSAKDISLFSQLMFSYKLNPQTVFYLGYSDSRGENDKIGLMLRSRTVFAKLGYFWLL